MNLMSHETYSLFYITMNHITSIKSIIISKLVYLFDLTIVCVRVSYHQDSISECQRAMVEMGDENGETEGDPGVEALVGTVRTVDEAQYLMQRMLAFTIEQSYIAAQKQVEARDMETRLQQVAQESDVQHQLLEHVLRDRDLLSLSNSNNTNNTTAVYSPPSSRSSSPDK